MLGQIKKSFSLLEVVFVVAIFLLVMGATISVVGLGYKNLFKNEARWKASILAQNFLEERSVIRDNNILKWINDTTPGVDDAMTSAQLFGGTAPYYPINTGLTCDAAISPWSGAWHHYRYYDYTMQVVAAAPYFYDLFYQCSNNPSYLGIFIVEVRWSQFNQNRTVQTRQFLKNTSGAIH